MARKRIALSVSEEQDIILERMSVLTNQPKTKLIMEIIDEFLPVLEKTVDALQQIQENKEKGPQIAKQFASEILMDSNEKLGLIATEAKKL